MCFIYGSCFEGGFFRVGFLSAQLCLLTCLTVYCRQDTLKIQIIYSCGAGEIPWCGGGQSSQGTKPRQDGTSSYRTQPQREGGSWGLCKIEITHTQTQKLPFWGKKWSLCTALGCTAFEVFPSLVLR